MTTRRILNKSRRKIKTIIIILIILLIILIGFIIKNSLYSKERIIQKLIYGMNNLNYTCNDPNTQSTIRVFGKKEKIINTDESQVYSDYENGISIYVSPENIEEKYNNNGIEEMQYYKSIIGPYFDNDNYEYRYVKKEYYNSQKCIVIESKIKLEDNRNVIIRFWINNSLYIVEKMENYIESDGKIYTTRVEEYDYHTNENTLNDVQIQNK